MCEREISCAFWRWILKTTVKRKAAAADLTRDKVWKKLRGRLESTKSTPTGGYTAPSLIASSGVKDTLEYDGTGVTGPRSARKGVSITSPSSGCEGTSAGGTITGTM